MVANGPPQPSPLGEVPEPSPRDKSSNLVSPKQLLKRARKKVGKAAKRVVPAGRSSRPSVNPLNLAATEASRNAQKQLETQQGEGGGPSRVIILGPTAVNEEFTGNVIKTAKYNVATFLPIFLFEVFSRAAYLYFLLQACLSWWSIVSPFGGFGSTAALVFVCLVAAVKALWEDSKRHIEDRKTNASTAHLVDPSGDVRDVPWRDIKVGQLVEVRDDELFPADILFLHTSLPASLCFIKTTNLDGETNLKTRKPLALKEDAPDSLQAALSVTGILECEVPNQNLHRFNGRFTNASGRQIPVTMEEILLRGCTLKNTGSITGMVVYTGEDSRIQRNASKTANKVGSFDHFLNFQIAFIILLQIAMCIFCAVASYIWRETYGKKRYFLALDSYTQGNYENGAAYTFILLITFWILYSYLVPISLFVTLEIVKFWQGFVYINLDKEMQDPASKEFARARNTNLNEDLGKIDYVFSDKTGTLTSNEMQLREISIKGIKYGSAEYKLEEHRGTDQREVLQAFDGQLSHATELLKTEGWLQALMKGIGSSEQILGAPTSFPPLREADAIGIDENDLPQSEGSPERALGQIVFGHHIVDFWMSICINNTLIVEANPEGGASYQGASPDEVALVEGAAALGYHMVRRPSNDTVLLRFAGADAEVEILNVLEFTSDRGRMSTIARGPDGTVRLFCKGSDAKMLQLIDPATPKDLVEATHKNLHLFATQGLRTLLLASRTLDEDWWSEWDARYQAASGLLEGREAKMAALQEEVERDLVLLGCTAIEDKLQDGVPAAIHTLLAAGIKVWVITGDKQETAINIAISCKLIRYPDSLLICNAFSPEAAWARLQELDSLLQAKFAPVGKQKTVHPEAANAVHPGELVIDGGTLQHILGTEAEQLLASVGSRCGSVVICRSSPAQKAAIVHMMAEHDMRQAEGGSTGLYRWYKRQMRKQAGRMLAIGDGANDVAMIQAADIGVGIMGKEGRQAVNNSDYAIGQFRFLTRLLLVHGSLSTYRLARLIKYSFYKNIAFGFVLFFYQFYCGYSGQALVDDISAAAYNVVFTSIPILLFAVLDRPVMRLDTLMRFPQSYNEKGSLTTTTFWRNGVLLAIVDAAICFFLPYYAINARANHNATDVYAVGKVVFIALLGTVTLEVTLVARYWTWLFLIFVLLSYFLVYPFEILFPLVEMLFNIYDSAQYGIAVNIFANASFWFIIILANAVTFGHRFIERAAVWLFKPNDDMILVELESLESGKPDYSWQTADRLAQLSSFTGHPPEVSTRGSMANGSMNGATDRGWQTVEMGPLPHSAGRKTKSLTNRHGNSPMARSLLPENSLPSHSVL